MLGEEGASSSLRSSRVEKGKEGERMTWGEEEGGDCDQDVK